MRIYKIAALSDETVKWWTNYASNLSFSSEAEARAWIKRKMESFPRVYPLEENEIQETMNMPLYRVNGKFKIGKREKTTKKQIEYLTRPDLVSWQKQTFATIMGHEFGKTFSKSVYVNNSKLRSFETIYQDNVLKIVDALLDEQSLPPILVDEDYSILDGNHRHMAAKKLGIRLVPCVFYYPTHDCFIEELK